MSGVMGQRSSGVSWVTTTTAAAFLCVTLIVAELPSTGATGLKGMKLALTEDGELFDLWKSASSSSLLKIYFFNITNPGEVLMGEKPRVTEVGPYAYRVNRQKENITFLEEGGKVAAVTRESFVFVSEESVGNPNVDLITTVNIPLVSLMDDLKSSSFMLRVLVSIWAVRHQMDIFRSLAVSKLLWGHKQPLFEKLHRLKPDMKNEDIGLLVDKNGNHSGEYVYLTGKSNYRDYARIDTWKGQREMSCWLSDHNNTIRGTDGRVFHPNVTKEERLDLFVPAMRRSIYLEFESDKDVRGIPAYRFTLPRSVLASAEVSPNNTGFCVSDCLGSGLLSLTKCDGSPYVVSLPHFLLADNVYLAAIDGLLPRKDLHQTYVEVNPATGVVLQASRTLQWNIILKRISGFSKTRHLKKTVVPIMYHKEVEEIDEVTETKLKRLLQTTQ